MNVRTRGVQAVSSLWEAGRERKNEIHSKSLGDNKNILEIEKGVTSATSLNAND
jgi:hypothetical protein